jgi:hypothetical protein
MELQSGDASHKSVRIAQTISERRPLQQFHHSSLAIRFQLLQL